MTEEAKLVINGNQKTIDDIYEAVKELTKTIASMAQEQKKLAEEIKTKVKAGRF